MHLQRNATQRNATQRNATQRIPELYLNNNFKFYIFQFFRAFSFLSVSFLYFVKEKQIICSFFVEKKNQKTTTFFVKKSGQKNNYNRITKSIRKNFFAVFGKSVIARLCRSNLYKLDCFTLFAMTIKNKFEIISQSDYGFCYKNYFFNLNQVFRNSYDFGERFGRNLNYDFEKNCSGGFGKNYFGNCNFGFDFGNEICGIWHDLAGFLFNRKIKK